MLPLWIGAAGVASAIVASYHAISPTSQVYGPTFIGTPGKGKQLALTYDDGPNDPHTLDLLNVLARHNVKATFFLIGKYVRQRPDIVQQIIAAGHDIGNHTYSHPNLIFLSDERLRLELNECRMALADAGVRIHGKQLFRPPFGARRPSTLRIARALDYEPIMWSVMAYDWQRTTSERVEAHIRRQTTGGDVILLHDGGHRHMGADRKHTVRATENIIRHYSDAGFAFLKVRDFLEPR